MCRFISLLFPIILCIPSALYSQGFKGGLLAGVAATQVDGDTYGGYHKAGPILGIWVERGFSVNWFWRLNFLYIQKGSYAKDKQSDVPDFYRMKLNYFELPVSAGYRLVSGFNVISGLSLGYLSKASEENALGAFPDQEVSAFHKFDFSAFGGMEYNYSQKWRFGLVFSYSLLAIRPYKDNISYRMNTGQRNRVIEFLAIYRIQ